MAVMEPGTQCSFRGGPIDGYTFDFEGVFPLHLFVAMEDIAEGRTILDLQFSVYTTKEKFSSATVAKKSTTAPFMYVYKHIINSEGTAYYKHVITT